MNKIEELIEKYEKYEGLCDTESVKDAMKEYAEYYAKECLEIAATKAQIYYDVGGYHFIDSDSILNIQLPKHEDLKWE